MNSLLIINNPNRENIMEISKNQNEYTICYNKCFFDKSSPKEKLSKRKHPVVEFNQSIDDVFETLRYSPHCKRELGLKFSSHSYTDGTINSITNNEYIFWNEDIEITPQNE